MLHADMAVRLITVNLHKPMYRGRRDETQIRHVWARRGSVGRAGSCVMFDGSALIGGYHMQTEPHLLDTSSSLQIGLVDDLTVTDSSGDAAGVTGKIQGVRHAHAHITNGNGQLLRA
jgi:hypothetical protein